ncbi:Dyp-type peroxidase [Roseovarius aestuariivivens]|uniref:Dyp-type peroxidase n=1 Tax=Roseovarius aestuariivivens TaxID=1888910 RepID=UPI0010818CC5|nr:hypothetical protein [Roseovarius aestuariivivens]
MRKDLAQDTQAIVASGFGRLEHGIALFLETHPGSGGGWLQSLQTVLPATAAIQTGGDLLPLAASIAFTASGLRNLGLTKEDLATFSKPFREGMMQEDRLRRLGDRRKSEWLNTVIEGGPMWSGNVEHAAPADADRSAKVSDKQAGEPVRTKMTIHAMVLLYAQGRADVETKTAEIEALLSEKNVRIVHSLPLTLDVEEGRNFSREHFGFADGISQPIPFDETRAVEVAGKPADTADPVHGVRLGEILLGHINGHQEIPPGPMVRDSSDNPLPAHSDALGFRDLGRNGSYMVVRQLQQDVAAFWQSMEKAAEMLRTQDSKADEITAEWVAEKVVGRGMDGRALRPDGRIPNGPNGEIENAFRYFDADRYGDGCPLGSHVRRSNPRDSLAPKEDMKETLLSSANNHRILRRARKYGSKIADKRTDDGEERGLLFICLNTDITRQFEFTQQTWLMNSDFSTLYEETDPLVGPDGEMTIPAEPLRYRAKVQTFVKLVGGEYFFLPSMTGLKFLATL